MKTFVFLLSFFSFYAFAHADQSQVPRPPKATIQWVTPFHVVVDFEDGGQAQLLAEEFPVIQTGVNLDMTESTCPGFMPKKKSCEFHVPLHIHLVALLWTKFPKDPSKVGQPVKRRTIRSYNSAGMPELSEPEEMVMAVDFADEYAVYSTPNVPNENKWSLSCQDQKLFQPIQKAATSLDVISLASETNTLNTETDVAENRGFQSLEDAHFDWQNGAYVLQSIGQGTGEFTVLAGQNLHWIVSPEKGMSCELSFSNDFSKLAAAIRPLTGKAPDFSKAKPPTWFGSDFGLKILPQTLPENLSFDGVLE